MSLEAGVMLPDMLSTGFMGAENANIPIGGSVAVLGIGPVGLSGIAGAKLRGAGRIFAVGTRPKPIEVAKAYGATDIISYKDGNTAEQILEKTDGEGVDAVIVSGGGPDILDRRLQHGQGRVVHLEQQLLRHGHDRQGLHPDPPCGLGRRHGQQAAHDRALPGGKVRMQRLAEVVMHGRMDPSLMATHVFRGFEQDRGGAALMKEKPPDLIKPVVICE